MKYIVSIDQGTTSSRTILFDENLNIVSVSQKEFTQIFPQPGWVEHDPEEIWQSQLFTIHNAIANANISISDILAIGITNQRETIVVWDKHTGKPVYNAIVWQDRRTADQCEVLKQKGLEKYIHENTGLIIDAYFSATKTAWILEHVDGVNQKAAKGELLCGTIDSWLIWKLTEGKIHATDVSNASRTMLYNIRELKWDQKLLSQFNIPENILPGVKDSVDDFGSTTLFGGNIPIRGVAGDQQAALFGQRCFEKGSAKNTYGTGCFMLMNIGDAFVLSKSKLLTTIAWKIGDEIQYALEGSVFVAGAVIQWLRDQLQIINSSEETEAVASSLSDNGGVYFVPAFTGLGAPHWDMYAKGLITGMSRGTNINHIVRAALESIAYQTNDVFDAMIKDTGLLLNELKVDGGASSNNWLLQFQSDLLQTKVIRPVNVESTALGAAMLAGIGSDIFTKESLKQKKQESIAFAPQMQSADARQLHSQWQQAVNKCRFEKS